MGGRPVRAKKNTNRKPPRLQPLVTSKPGESGVKYRGPKEQSRLLTASDGVEYAGAHDVTAYCKCVNPRCGARGFHWMREPARYPEVPEKLRALGRGNYGVVDVSYPSVRFQRVLVDDDGSVRLESAEERARREAQLEAQEVYKAIMSASLMDFSGKTVARFGPASEHRWTWVFRLAGGVGGIAGDGDGEWLQSDQFEMTTAEQKQCARASAEMKWEVIRTCRKCGAEWGQGQKTAGVRNGDG